MRLPCPSILAVISVGLAACGSDDSGVVPAEVGGGPSTSASAGGAIVTSSTSSSPGSGGKSAVSATQQGGVSSQTTAAVTGGVMTSSSKGGSAANAGGSGTLAGGAAKGGASATGGATSSGGKSTNGTPIAGRAATGGARSGGANSGGTNSSSIANGGSVRGGSANGGSANGGTSSAVGGKSGTGAGSSSGGSAAGGSSSSCSVAPVNPNATQQAKNLLCYIYSIYGKSVLSGQQETSWVTDPATDVNWIKTQTGKYPAILGGDYLYPDGTTARALDWWKNGGITMIRYHMGAPPNSDTYDNSKGTADINAVLTSGSSANTSFDSKLDYIAKELLTLQSSNVAVLWAPFHEVQANGWFWWAKGTAAQFKSLWKYMFDYLTNTKKINNLVWLFPYSNNPAADYYPGKETVDVAGADIYQTSGMPYASLYSATSKIVGTTIPIALHETGTVPQPSTMFPSSATWVLFNIWASYENDTSKNSVSAIKSAYDDSHTITLDEVPNLK